MGKIYNLISKRNKYSYLWIYLVIMVILLLLVDHAPQGYEYLRKDTIMDNLHEETAVNFTSSASIDCEYHDVIFDETKLSGWSLVTDYLSLVHAAIVDGKNLKEGGEYAPSECKPKFSTAIIVPVRDRAEQLHGFLIYMHMLLRRQKIHYRMYVVEQVDSGPFNKATLMNIAALAAMRAGYPCIILHDVDMLPTRLANLYACTKRPRHMAPSVDKFRYILPYVEIFGGAVALLSEQFRAINGMTNEYFGWGGEDDDLHDRLVAVGISICRFDPEIGRYHMVIHKTHQKEVPYRGFKARFAKDKMKTDGLSSLRYKNIEPVLHPLYTHIMVTLW